MQKREDLQSDYQSRDAQGQHAGFGMSRRFLRMAISMMKTSHIYLPKSLRASKTNMNGRADYYIKTWPKLIEKWHRAQALDIAFDKNMPLGQWRNIVQELYGIELRL